MNLYLDSSVLLRLVLTEAGGLEEVRQAEVLVSSELLAVETRRTIDRLRHQGALAPDEALRRAEIVNDWLEAVDLVLFASPSSAGPASRYRCRSARSMRFTSRRRWSGGIAPENP